VRSLALSYNPPRYISRASGRCQLLDPRGGVQRAVGCAAHVRRLKSSVHRTVWLFLALAPCAERRKSALIQTARQFCVWYHPSRGSPHLIRLPWAQCAATTCSSDHGGAAAPDGAQ
jgi:hypothetical protein